MTETRVTRADAPKLLEYRGFDMRWELEASGWRHAPDAVAQHRSPLHLDGALPGGTFVSMSWTAFSRVTPIGRIVGADAMKFAGWQRLIAEYAKQFGVETPNWPPDAPKL